MMCTNELFFCSTFKTCFHSKNSICISKGVTSNDSNSLQGGQTALPYSLASNFPRRVFSGADSAGESLAALGLTPQALLFVQPADDD